MTYPLLGVAAQQPASSAEKEVKPDSKLDLSKLKVTELVDKLQEESEEGIGTHSTASASGFLANDEEPQFRGGILGSHKPKTSPVMRELVRRGVAALPDLIDHLNDKRATKLVLPHMSRIHGCMWHSNEYHPRSRDPKKHPLGVDTALEGSVGSLKTGRFEAKYAIRVGDLCYVAIGQIVNRSLKVLRYQPTLCIVINSPIETPALADAVKQDWAGLTVEKHRQSLYQDALSKYPYETASAMVRLHFYYPQEGEALALKLLARPLYQDRPLWDFIWGLVKEDDPAKWKAMIEEFREAQGQAAADAIPFRLHWIYFRTSDERNKEFLESKDRASKILAQFYPGYDPYAPSFINAATPDEQCKLINSLDKCQSQEIDQAVYRVFQSAANRKATNENECYDLDGPCFACMFRLVGKGHDDEFREFVARRIKAVEALPEWSNGRLSLDALRRLQDRLRK
jgi:hypothetical protein